MSDDLVDDNNDNFIYLEREATAVFPDESSLDRAVDALMQLGLRQDAMSVLAHSARLNSSRTSEQLADGDQPDVAAFTSQDTRTEARAALIGGPALLAGLGAALAISTAGAALIPAFVVTAGSAAVGGGVGMLFARIFGRKHATYITEQISHGGVILWAQVPDEKQDQSVLDILTANGGRDAHIHVVKRQWGINSIPFYNAQPDPFLRG